MQKIGFLGPKGTFSHEAVILYCELKKEKFEETLFESIADVMFAVDNGEIDVGIVPIENSIEGAVSSTLDTFIDTSGVYIEEEFVLPIHQYLLGKRDVCYDFSKTDEILSHPQPLGQCRNYLRTTFPKIRVKSVGSTAAAVEEMLRSSGNKIAIASKAAAEIYGLQILDKDIQDEDNNSTRFVVVSKTVPVCENKNKISIVFSTGHQPGELYKVLDIFNLWDMNLAKIESRPSRRSLGEYVFFVDIVGHYKDEDVEDAFRMIKRKTLFFKLLGSYNEIRI